MNAINPEPIASTLPTGTLSLVHVLEQSDTAVIELFEKHEAALESLFGAPCAELARQIR